MVEFGEEVILESLRIPWLIWIQLLVFFLLILLIYCFTIVSGEDNVIVSGEENVVISSGETPSYSSRSLTSSSSQKQPLVFQFHHQVGENQSIIRDATNISRGGSYYSNNNNGGSSSNQLHPCNIISLAKIAFLKCLGLDNNNNNNNNNNVLDKDQINER